MLIQGSFLSSLLNLLPQKGMVKMRGEYPFTLNEALRLKSVLQTDLSIEDLFGSAA